MACERCTVADRALARARGLLGRRELPPGEGLLLRPAASIHTWFMRFAIDAVFLDADLRVLAVRSDLRPWRVASRRGARAVLELAAGEARRRGIAPGARLRLGLGGQTALMTDPADPGLAPGDEAPPDRDEVAANVCPACGGSGRVEEAVGGG